MKKTLMIATVFIGLTAASLTAARAGDREWATVGKVLTGAVAFDAITHGANVQLRYSPGYAYDCAPTPSYRYNYDYCPPPRPVYCPPSRPVYCPPPRVVYCPPPVVVYRDNDYCRESRRYERWENSHERWHERHDRW